MSADLIGTIILHCGTSAILITKSSHTRWGQSSNQCRSLPLVVLPLLYGFDLAESVQAYPDLSVALAFLRPAPFDAITVISSCQDLANDFAPSFCRRVANSSMSMPTLANSASTSSQSPPSAGMIEPSSHCS